MPGHGVVNEKDWDRAKTQAKKEYPELGEEDDKLWAITSTIYKNISKGHGHKAYKKEASINGFQKLLTYMK